jgi:hypothetical protein
MVTSQKKSGPVAKAKLVRRNTEADVSDAFRRARSSIADITADLQQLRQHAQASIKRTQRPAKSK